MLKKLGNGAFSTVYLATDEAGDKVVVKVTLGDEQNANAQHEHDILQALEEVPHIPRAMGFGSEGNDYYYLKMRYEDGLEMNLAQYMDESHQVLEGKPN